MRLDIDLVGLDKFDVATLGAFRTLQVKVFAEAYQTRDSLQHLKNPSQL